MNNTTQPGLRNLMQEAFPSRRLRLWLSIFVSLCVTVYLCDYLSVRYRIAKKREPFEVVKIQRYYAVRLKDGKTEFEFLEPETQTCINSLFPHSGCSPCWYVKRKAVKRVDL